MPLVEHCVPLMVWGTVVWLCSVPLVMLSAFLLGFAKAAAESEHWSAIPAFLVGLPCITVGIVCGISGKISLLLGVLGCVLSCFVKG